MKITLQHRTQPAMHATYNDPVSITIDRADVVYNPSDITGNGLTPDTMLLTIRLQEGEPCTFTAANWKILFMQ